MPLPQIPHTGMRLAAALLCSLQSFCMLMPRICRLQQMAEAHLQPSYMHCALASPSYGAPGVAMPSRLQRLRAVLLDFIPADSWCQQHFVGFKSEAWFCLPLIECLPLLHYANTTGTLTATQLLKLIRSTDIFPGSCLSLCSGQLGCKLSLGCLKLNSVCSHCFLVYLAPGKLTVRAFFLCLQSIGIVMLCQAWVMHGSYSFNSFLLAATAPVSALHLASSSRCCSFPALWPAHTCQPRWEHVCFSGCCKAESYLRRTALLTSIFRGDSVS